MLVADYGRGVTRVPSMPRSSSRASLHTRRWYGIRIRVVQRPTEGVSLCTPNRAEATLFAPQIGGDSLTADLSRARHLRQVWRTVPSPSHAVPRAHCSSPVSTLRSWCPQWMHRPMPMRAGPVMPLRRRRQLRSQDELSCRRRSNRLSPPQAEVHPVRGSVPARYKATGASRGWSLPRTGFRIMAGARRRW